MKKANHFQKIQTVPVAVLPGSQAPLRVLNLLTEIMRLMELTGTNPFKLRAFEHAYETISQLSFDELIERARNGTLTELDGIGKSISEIITEFLLKGSSRARDELTASLPVGLEELTRVPGLGPKKARKIIEELDIHSVRELEYACRENRLLKLKGFGERAQQQILDKICFYNASSGQQRWVDVLPLVGEIMHGLTKAIEMAHPRGPALRVHETGALRRRLETLAELEFLVELPDDRSTAEEVRAQADKFINQLRSKGSSQLPIKIYFAHSHRFGYELAKTTGSEAHWSALGKPVPFDVWNEEAFYSAMGLPLIPPEARETGEEVALAKGGMLEKLLPWDGIQGVFHAHTQRSDGAASLEQMVRAAKELGYRYIGISDHSQSAFYAQGLKVPELLEQERELRKVQEKYPEIRIFWGIESDILADGSLDYDAKVLKRFDFVIASVHSRFKMDKLAMTQRIVAAIQNPYTRFLGHMTGRLLLGRPAYDLDVERVICEAAQHEVAIEINAHPARLDIDWRWGRCLRDTGTLVSINPDAHDARGLRDTVLGIGVARKALLPADLVLNSRSVTEVERWLRRA